MALLTSKVISIGCAAALVAGAVWGYGFLAGKNGYFPAGQVNEVLRISRSVLRYGEIVPSGMRMPPPPGAARERAVVLDADAAMGAGYYAILGWNGLIGSYSVWLHDAGSGEILHRWDVNEMSFYEGAAHNSNAPHGLEVLEDGAMVIGFDYLGMMARLNACSRPDWVKTGFYHHVFSRAEDGGVWTWFGEGSPYGHYQYMVKFDPKTGDTITRIGLVEDVIARSPEVALLFSMRGDSRFLADDEGPADIFHPNDVEELTTALAPAFPMFEVGDLLISLRSLNMVAVLGQDGSVKWLRQGPWLMQHDPDFRPDGTISVYNNASQRDHSDIILADPATGSVRSLLGDWDVPFKSNFRGMHQLLPNGNTMVLVPEQGQVLETTPAGKLVMAFNNVAAADSAYNEDVAAAKWYPPGYFDTLPTCSDG